jgi:hypothetical protein
MLRHLTHNGVLCRSRLMTGDDGLSETSSSVGALVAGRGGTGVSRSIGRDSSSDGGDEWDAERRAALQADRAAVEAAWGAHVADNDIASLRWKAVGCSCLLSWARYELFPRFLMTTYFMRHADQQVQETDHRLCLEMMHLSVGPHQQSLYWAGMTEQLCSQTQSWEGMAW